LLSPSHSANIVAVTKLNESQLRLATSNWLKQRYDSFKFHLPIMIFHNLGMSLKDFLLKKFDGDDLACIPNYFTLNIRPDIIGILVLPNSERRHRAWIIAECKSKKAIGYSDFRQFADYAQKTNAYGAYFVYNDNLSSEIEDQMRSAGTYDGMNRWGQITRKRLIITNYENGRFRRRYF